tara:strand:+ start:115 stop:1230 length:1116 start_codon:yes stop_codon:yes gene_type:complete
MDSLHVALTEHFFEDRYRLSTSKQVGEGEHKIFGYIRENHTQLKDKDIIIYGLDADLIMLALHHVKYVRNIYLYRETPEFIKHISVRMESDQKYVLDINELKHIIEKNCKIDDYLLMGFLLGNDFLPHFPSINIRERGFERLLDTKKTHFGRLTTDSSDSALKIVWDNMRKFMMNFVTTEKTEFAKVRTKMMKHKQTHTQQNTKIEDLLNNIPQYERSIEEKINPNKIDWKFHYYKELFDIDIRYDKLSIRNICINYMEGLEWTLKYYTGQPINWSWSYSYCYPPLLEDLLDYMPFYEVEFIKESPCVFTEKMQLCYVLPIGSMHLLDCETRSMLNMECYGDNFEIIWAFCRYFWESHVILPKIDISSLPV